MGGQRRALWAAAVLGALGGLCVARELGWDWAPDAWRRGAALPSSLAAAADLTRLPAEARRVVAVILLMPLGAVVTCVFRNVIGLQTSGRFAPMLLALSFVFADWRTGLMVFAAVVAVGVAGRSLLEPLQLLMLPRLSIMLTLVVWCLVFGVSLLDARRWTPSSQAVLLPMVILTMVVERFYVTSQEDGPGVALRRLGATLVVGAVCYLVLGWRAVADFYLRCPEAHLLTLAVLLLLGRYTGYRLTEWWRFRDLGEG